MRLFNLLENEKRFEDAVFLHLTDNEICFPMPCGTFTRNEERYVKNGCKDELFLSQ